MRHWNGCFGKIFANKRMLFFHRDDLVDVLELQVGDWAEFDVVENVRGPRAENVRPYGAGAPARASR